MGRRAPHLQFALILMGAAVAAVSACHRPSSAETALDERERVADSTRNANIARNRSSATQAATFDDTERTRYTRVEQMIQARFSGVTVTPSGSGFAIRIRGAGSFGASNEPLVILDGTSRTVADLRGVDPRVVERIEIIKDGAAALYGSRGANGVIVITTKRGR